MRKELIGEPSVEMLSAAIRAVIDECIIKMMLLDPIEQHLMLQYIAGFMEGLAEKIESETEQPVRGLLQEFRQEAYFLSLLGPSTCAPERSSLS
jgi:hypothetical protein